jgi:xanthine permease
MSSHPGVVAKGPAAVGGRPEDERLTLAATLGYGVQHILAMFGGVIAVPIIIGGAAGLKPSDQALLISCSLFISGLATLLQTLGVPFFGSQLPVVQGISFGSVSTLLTIIPGKGTDGLRTAFGAIIVAGLIALLIVPFFAQIVRFFPPVVTGSIIAVIGLSLMPVAGKWITGQPTLGGNPNPNFANVKDIALGTFTLVVVLILSRVKTLARLAILLSLLIGTIVAFFTGQASFSISGASAFAIPMPFTFGSPLFAAGAIASMLVVMLVIMAETTADIMAVGEIVGTEVPPKRVADGLRADMLSSTVAPVFNTFPATAFAQNVGLVALTGVKSRFAVALGGGILALAGLSPWFAAIIGVIPLPVLGGAGIALFGMVAASGIRSLTNVDFDGTNNLLIVSVALGFGLLPSLVGGFWGNFPAWFEVIAGSGISAAAIIAVVLNIFFNMLGKPKAGGALANAPAKGLEEKQLERLH